MTGRSEDDARRAWSAMSELVLSHDRKLDVAERLGLSFARIRTLRRLADGPLTLRELAAKLVSDPPYVTLMIDDLEDRGLVRRKPHPADRRAKLVELTASGRKTVHRAEAILGEPPAGLARLDAAELSALADALAKATAE